MTETFLICLAAFAAGAINAVAGGGTFISFPALTGFGHLSEKAANITSTLGLWPGSAASVVAARHEFKRLPRGMVIGYSLICIVGGALGSILLLYTTASAFKLVIPWLLLFATIIFAASKPIARFVGRHHGSGHSTGWTILIGCVQFIVALYGGYFGAGIGVLTLAGLAFTGLEDIHQMNAMKVLLATLINGIACIIFLFGHPAWHLVIPMAVCSIASGFLGMALARRIQQDKLRALILICGITLTAAYFVKNYGQYFRN